MSVVRRLAGTVAVAGLLWWPAASASAHPFGAPQTAEITATDSGVRVHWTASPDDVTALAISLGVVDPTRTFVYDNGVMVPEESDETDGVTLAAAPELSIYLLEHVAVTVDGTACPGRLLPGDDVVAQGAVIDFDCGDVPSAAEVRIDTLTDIDTAYRTMAHGPDEVLGAYTLDSPVITWHFSTGADAVTDAGPSDRFSATTSAALQIGGIGSTVAVGGCAWWFVAGRRSRRPGDT